MAAENVVMQGATFAKRDARQRTLRGIGRLTDRFRHFACFAVPKADSALLIAHNNQRCKTEATATLHNLRNAIDVHQLVDEFAVALLAIAPASTPLRRAFGLVSH
jgi:hypothetical protein